MDQSICFSENDFYIFVYLHFFDNNFKMSLTWFTFWLKFFSNFYINSESCFNYARKSLFRPCAVYIFYTQDCISTCFSSFNEIESIVCWVLLRMDKLLRWLYKLLNSSFYFSSICGNSRLWRGFFSPNIISNWC